MINIAEALHIPDQKNNFTINSKFSTENSKQIFSDIFNNEKRNLLFGKGDAIKNVAYNEQNKIKNTINQTSNPNNANKPDNKFKSDASSNRVSPNKTEQPKKCENTDTKETTEDTEEEKVNKDMTALQFLLLMMLDNIQDCEDADSKNIEIDADQLQELDSLKEQLLSLLETSALSDDSLKQNIETIVDTINKISDELLLHNKGQLSVLKSDELVDNLEEIKSNIQSILNRPDIAKPANLQNLYAEEDFSNSGKKQSAENKETLSGANNTEKSIKNSVKSIDKFILDNSREQFPEQFKKDSDILSEGQIVVFQQGVNNRTIDLEVMKQIMEPKQFINEIAQKAGAFILKGKNEMSIQLIPEHLGKLSIKIGLNEGTLTGKIYAENYSVKETIEANLDQLRNSLEEQGLNIAGLEVHINDNLQNFERNLYKPKFINRQKTETDSVGINSNFITLEESTEQANPYLITSKIDSLV